MNIGMDIEGTITQMPEFFAILAKAIRQSGGKVYVLSGQDEVYLERTGWQLRQLGIEYDYLCLFDGSAATVAAWKARLAVELGCDLFIDDSIEVLSALPKSVKGLRMLP